MLRRAAIVLLLAATGASAAAIDGTWLITRQNQKGELTFELKLQAEGSKLTGTLGRQGARRTQPISDGKIEGESFSFSVVQRNKKGEFTMLWKGTVAGDEIRGEAGREGRRMQPYTAKRAE